MLVSKEHSFPCLEHQLESQNHCSLEEPNFRVMISGEWVKNLEETRFLIIMFSFVFSLCPTPNQFIFCLPLYCLIPKQVTNVHLCSTDRSIQKNSSGLGVWKPDSSLGQTVSYCLSFIFCRLTYLYVSKVYVSGLWHFCFRSLWTWSCTVGVCVYSSSWDWES